MMLRFFSLFLYLHVVQPRRRDRGDAAPLKAGGLLLLLLLLLLQSLLQYVAGGRVEAA